MRAVIVAAAVAFIISLFGTPVAIRVFTALKAGQPIRAIGPSSHQGKKGTPTMGGVAFIVATVFAYVAGHVALTTLPERQIAQEGPTMTALVLLGLFVFCGVVGFLDDFLKVRQRNSDGLSAKGKLLGQLIVGTGFGIVALYVKSTNGETVASEHISFIRDISWLNVGKVGSVIVFVFVIMSMSNGVEPDRRPGRPGHRRLDPGARGVRADRVSGSIGTGAVTPPTPGSTTTATRSEIRWRSR